MGQIIGAFGTSHAFTFMEPESWDGFREKNRANLKKRRNIDAPEQPQALAESLPANKARFEHIRFEHAQIRNLLAKTRPDALVLIGDDQNEVFSSVNIPQIGVYVGGDFKLSPRYTKGDAIFRSHDALAQEILATGIGDGFDIASIGAFADGKLAAHAHAQVLEAFAPTGGIPIVPVFLNAVYHPAIEPPRCYAFGQVIRAAVERCSAVERVVVAASGGWSHFTAGYPWHKYTGPYSYGAISEDFDRQIAERIKSGRGQSLTEFSSDDFLAHGNIELRAWVAMLGAIGAPPPNTLTYEPFYRAIMGMAAGTWMLEARSGATS